MYQPGVSKCGLPFTNRGALVVVTGVLNAVVDRIADVDVVDAATAARWGDEPPSLPHPDAASAAR